MALFEINKEPGNKPGEVFSAVTRTKNYFRKASTVAELTKAIGKLEQGQCVFTFEYGKWSSHELLAYILLQTGPAKLWFSTWSITEEPLRVLIRLKKAGLLTEINALFGDRVTVMSPVAWQYASYNIPDIRLGKCHAKVQVIINDTWQVAVMGSANFTNNPRWEAGVVCCDKTVAEGYRQSIEEARNTGRKYVHRETIE